MATDRARMAAATLLAGAVALIAGGTATAAYAGGGVAGGGVAGGRAAVVSAATRPKPGGSADRSPVADPDPSLRPDPGAVADVAGPSAGTAVVTTVGGPLNERSGPTTAYGTVRTVADGATVTIMCQAYGETVAGRVATSAWWELLSSGGYVTDGYLSWHPTRPTVPWCGASKHRAVTATVDTERDPLSVRSTANKSGVQVGTVAKGTVVTVVCHVWGWTVAGTHGRTATWSQLSKGHYVADAYLDWAPDQPYMPWCGEGPAIVAPSTNAAFIRQSVGPAQASMISYKVPAAVTIAQAILESGWGVSSLTVRDHNYFGMKCFGNPGPIAVGCRGYATHECGPHGCYPTTASFRAYRGVPNSFADHGRLLATASRYANAFKYAGNPDKFAQTIQKDGYATSPTYAANLISIMKKYRLYQYDKITA